MKNNNNFLISVIIPAYNADHFISRAIESVLSQTLSNIEVIVVDDGSIDNTATVVKSFEGQVRYYYQSNKGVAAARNLGIQNANGNYVAFLDADDYVLSPMYSTLLKEAKDSTADIIMCGIYLENENKIRREIYRYKKAVLDLKKRRDLKKAFEIIGNSSCNKLYKKTLIQDKKFPQYKRGEDALFVLECLLQANKVSVVNEPLYVYFQNSNSVTKSKISEEVLKNHEIVHKEKRKLLIKNYVYKDLENILKDYYVKCFLMYTNGIRSLSDVEQKKLCWDKWFEVNKEDFIKNTSISRITRISNNIDFVYFIGMIVTGKFFHPLITRIGNINFFLK